MFYVIVDHDDDGSHFAIVPAEIIHTVPWDDVITGPFPLEEAQAKAGRLTELVASLKTK